MQFTMKLIVMFMVLTIYYKFVKTGLMHLADYLSDLAPRLLQKTNVITRISRSDIKGVLELFFIAISHVGFCFILFQCVSEKFNIDHNHYIFMCIYGVLLGIGCMGTSALLCNILVFFINACSVNKYDLKTWLTMSRGGWIKHHLQSFEILPYYFSLPILIMQVGSEEIIFRICVFDYFSSFGIGVAMIMSVFLFTLMQAFLMHRWQSSIFPMVGAFVMGTAHSLLYYKIPVIWPLVISHVSFFIFSIL